MTRITATERIHQRNRAEVEIQRFAAADPATGIRPHALWAKHVHNVELDPMQVLKMHEMDQHRSTIDVSCRRTGKTAVKEMHILEELATTAAQECGVVAPRAAGAWGGRWRTGARAARRRRTPAPPSWPAPRGCASP